jgi:hypothetical protein
MSVRFVVHYIIFSPTSLVLQINMMYELILAQKKAQEAALMADVPGIKVKPKYEYDSDEETDDIGTWEHRNRTAEMDATKGKLMQSLSKFYFKLPSVYISHYLN